MQTMSKVMYEYCIIRIQDEKQISQNRAKLGNKSSKYYTDTEYIK